MASVDAETRRSGN